MSTITRERVAQYANDPRMCNVNDEIRQIARIALASLEVEPAIHRWRRVTVEPYGPYPWHYGSFIGFSQPVEGIEDDYFYSAPPAPVVQGKAEPVSNRDELPSREHFISLCNQFWNWQEADEINAGDEEPRLEWNGSAFTHRVTQALWRMYQESPGNSPVIPDGWVAVHEEMPPQGEPLLICTSEGVVQRTVYGFDGENWLDWYELYDPVKADRCDLWQRLPAATQQEVKS